MSRNGPIYYESLHTTEDGKDIYLNVLYEIIYEDGTTEMKYESSKNWNLSLPRDSMYFDYTSLPKRPKMISFKDSGRELELRQMIPKNKY